MTFWLSEYDSMINSMEKWHVHFICCAPFIDTAGVLTSWAESPSHSCVTLRMKNSPLDLLRTYLERSSFCRLLRLFLISKANGLVVPVTTHPNLNGKKLICGQYFLCILLLERGLSWGVKRSQPQTFSLEYCSNLSNIC